MTTAVEKTKVMAAMSVEQDIARQCLARKGLLSGVVVFDGPFSGPFVEGFDGVPHSTPEQREGHTYPNHSYVRSFFMIVMDDA